MLGIFVLIFLFALVALPATVIKPNLVSKFINSTRKKNALFFGGLAFLSFVMIGILAPSTPTSSATKQIETPGAETINNIPTKEPIPTTQIVKEPTPTVKPTNVPTAKPTVKPTSKPIVVSTIKPLPTSTPKPYIAPTSAPLVNSQPETGGFSCSCSKTCTQISSCAEAQFQLNSCGCGARDNDNDGVACDSAPLNCQ